MDKLKPCPFCGNKQVKSTVTLENVGIVFCHKCGGQLRYYGDEMKARELWNRRADNEPHKWQNKQE